MSVWQPINTAPQVEGNEVLGCKFQFDGKRMIMVREPFVSCWSPSTGKYTSSPSHWTEAPGAPAPTEKDRSRKKPATTT